MATHNTDTLLQEVIDREAIRTLPQRLGEHYSHQLNTWRATQ